MGVISIKRVLLGLLATGLALASPLLENPLEPRQQQCTNRKLRRAWHTLTLADRRRYIDAELCLMQRQATLGLRGAVTKFDELQSVHVLEAEAVHFTGAFLPFHRLFVWAHEIQLERECGYTGGQPYWEETIDAGNFAGSVILNPDTGFGGNGDPNTRCITNGPFRNYVNRLGLSYAVQDQCIRRRINETASAFSSREAVQNCLNMQSWGDARRCIENRPHLGGHNGMGGQVANPISSPGDPLFYMHHAWLDKVWWDWQRQDLDNRISASAMGGPNVQGGPSTGNRPCPQNLVFPPRPADLPAPRVDGDPGCATTLNHVLHMHGIIQDRTIARVMDIRGELCYRYVNN